MVQLLKTGIGIVLPGILILSLVVIPVTAARLATPVLVTPANGQHFYHDSGDLWFTWKPVPDATDYIVDTERRSGTSWVAYPSQSINKTVIKFDAPLNQTCRWRVQALDLNVTDGAHDPSLASAWRTFDFSVASERLATPVLLSPPAGTIFSNSPGATTFAWKPVPGTDTYLVNVERYDTVTRTWIFYSNFTRAGDLNTAISPFFGLGQHRWRVTAYDDDDHWYPSNPSAWRTFTYRA